MTDLSPSSMKTQQITDTLHAVSAPVCKGGHGHVILELMHFSFWANQRNDPIRNCRELNQVNNQGG